MIDQLQKTCSQLGLKLCNVRHWQLAQQMNYYACLEEVNCIYIDHRVIKPGDTITWIGEDFTVDACFVHVALNIGGTFEVGAQYFYVDGDLIPVENIRRR